MSLPKFVSCLSLLAVALCGNVHADEAGYRNEVTVNEATRLDWTFALSNQSRVDPPEEWLRGYDSTRQRYELFVPPKPKDRKLGHGIPDGKAFGPVLEWLDKGAAGRRELAAKHPASRLECDHAPSRDECSKGLLAEGRTRIKDRATIYSGLMQLQGVRTRWPDLPAADEAKRILLDYDNRNDKPWEADDIAEQRKFLIARARGLDAYASDDLPEQYQKLRPNMLKAAIALWEQVIEDGQDAQAVAEARRRLPMLTKLVDAE